MQTAEIIQLPAIVMECIVKYIETGKMQQQW